MNKINELKKNNYATGFGDFTILAHQDRSSANSYSEPNVIFRCNFKFHFQSITRIYDRVARLFNSLGEGLPGVWTKSGQE